MKKVALLFLSLSLLLSGCAGPNPNVGERTVDLAWYRGDYAYAVKAVTPRAEAGQPWAQLRLGMFYELGMGVDQDIGKAADWYEKAAVQKAEGGWAEGLMIGAVGPVGYFNQNGDARIAQYKLARIQLEGKGVSQDLMKAYFNIRTVKEESQGKPLFFCCNFDGGRFFLPEQIDEIYEQVLKEMSPEQRAQAESLYSPRSASAKVK